MIFLPKMHVVSRRLILLALSIGSISCAMSMNIDESNKAPQKNTPKRRLASRPEYPKDSPWHPDNLYKLERIVEYVEPIVFPVSIEGLTNATVTLKSSSHSETMFVAFEKRDYSWILEPAEKPTKVIKRPNLKGLNNLLYIPISRQSPHVREQADWNEEDQNHWKANFVLYIPNDDKPFDFELEVHCDEIWGSFKRYSFEKILTLRDHGVQISLPLESTVIPKTKGTVTTLASTSVIYPMTTTGHTNVRLDNEDAAAVTNTTTVTSTTVTQSSTPADANTSDS